MQFTHSSPIELLVRFSTPRPSTHVLIDGFVRPDPPHAIGGGIDSVTPRVLLAIAVVLVVSRAIGALFKRIDQPIVVGEMLAGVLLGPSLIGPSASEFLFPGEILPFLKVIAEVGLVIFMFVVGVDMDARLIRGRERVAAVVSASSVIVPFVLGAGLGLALYSKHDFVNGSKVPRLAFVLFFGAAMSATAFPVLARILSDRGMFRTPLGAIALACAAVDDILAWSLLAFVVAIADSSGLVSGGSMNDAGLTFLLAAAFCALMFFVIKPLLRRLVTLGDDEDEFPTQILTIVLIGTLLSAWATAAIGVHAVFGAFLFGAIMPRENSQKLFAEILVRIEHISVSLLLPVFFIVTGLGVDLRTLGATGILTLLLIIVVATAGKFVGTAAAARAMGLRPRRAAALGILMNTRGLTELVILAVGRDLGILDDQLFAMLVVMAIVTTVMTGPALARAYPERLLRRDQVIAENLENLDGFHVLAAAETGEALQRLSHIAELLTASERPAAVSILSVVRQQSTEIASGIPVDYVDTTWGPDDIEQFERRLERSGLATSVTTLMSPDPVSDMRDRLAEIRPNLIVTDTSLDDWHLYLVDSDDLAVVFDTGSWPQSFANGQGCVRLELEGDTPLAVEVAARASMATGVPVTLVDASGGQRRRINSFRERLHDAGIPTSDADDCQPIITVRDFALNHRPEMTSVGPPMLHVPRHDDDQGDRFQRWLDNVRRSKPDRTADQPAPHQPQLSSSDG